MTSFVDGHHTSESFARSEIVACTARIFAQTGFTHASESSLCLVSDIMRQHLQKMCSTIHSISEHCGRTQVNLGDVDYAYHRMHISVDEMNTYLTQVRPLPPRVLPQFPPAHRSRNHPIRIRPIAQPCLRPEHFPHWAPPVCSAWLKEPPQMLSPPAPFDPKRITEETMNITPFPDFLAETSVSLGLCKSKKQPVQFKKLLTPLSRVPSFNSSRPPSRPPSRVEALREFAAEEAASSRPSSSMSATSENGQTAQPMFKRRIGKRKSNEDVHSASPTPTPPPPPTPTASAPVPSAISRLREQHTNMSELMESVKTSNRATPSVPREPPTRQQFSTPSVSDTRSAVAQPTPTLVQGSVLTLASDLANDPRKVVVAALTGRSVPVAPPSPLRPIPRNTDNLKDPPRDDEQPNRIVQMAVLRHLFSRDCDLQEQLDQAFEHISGKREATAPIFTPLVVDTTEPPPIYEVVRVEKPVAKVSVDPLSRPPLPVLKIKLSRNTGSSDPSPASFQTASASQSSDTDTIPEKKRKKHKKKKKKRNRSHREGDDMEVDGPQTPSELPVVQETNGGFRLKIRLRPPSNPSAEQ